ncbi:MAG: response regulator transcription factor [Bacteroidales bacterium]
MENISILISDDHQLFREGMKLILNNLSYVDEIYEVGNGKDCVAFFREGGTADIVFMDIEMPGMNGIEATIEVLKIKPDLNVIALSMYSDEDYYTKMIDAGAKGFILKNSGIKEVEEAIEHVLSGKNYFSQEILSGFIKSISRKKEPEYPFKLSDREAEVLFLICKGHSNHEIAGTLHISKRTVDKHRENLLHKTGSKNTAGLVIYAIKNNIVEVDL